MAEPRIAVRIGAKGSEDVTRRLDEIRAAGTKSFETLGKAGKAVGQGIEESLTRAQRAVSAVSLVAAKTTGAVGQTVHSTERLISGLVGRITGIAGVLGITGLGVTATLAGTYAGLRSVSVSTGEYIEKQLQLSKTTGVAIDVLTRYQSAARLAGGTGNVIGTGFQNITNKLIEAAKGNAEALKPFVQLDLKIRDNAGNLKTYNQILDEVIGKLQAISDPARRAKAATDLFGEGASDIVPLLEKGAVGMQKLLQQADDYGVKLNEADAKRTTELLLRKRRVDEALLGLKFTISNAFLPIFTDSSESVANWLQKNSKAIRAFITDIGKTLRAVQNDVGKILTGNQGPLENSLIRTLAPALRLVRNLGLETLYALAGRGTGLVLPWVVPAIASVKAFKNLVVTVKDTFQEFIEAITGPLPSKTVVFTTVKNAIADVQTGLKGLGNGGEAPGLGIIYPVMVRLGEGIRNASRAAVEIGATLIGISPGIIDFARNALGYAADAAQALRLALAGERIPGTNYFAFVDELLPYLTAAAAEAKTIFEGIFGEASMEAVRDKFVATFKVIAGYIRMAVDYIKTFGSETGSTSAMIVGAMDRIAKAVGLADWKQLGIVLFLGYLVGALPFIIAILHAFALALGIIVTTISLVTGAFKLIITVFTLVFTVVRSVYLAFLFLSFLYGSIPVLLAAAIAAAIAALALLVYYLQDELVDAAKAAVSGIYGAFTAVAQWIGENVVAPIIALFVTLWDGIVSAAEATVAGVQAAWAGTVAFFTDLWTSLTKAFRDGWEAIQAFPENAWKAMTNLWSGMVDFFMKPINAVASLFKDMWEGVKSGAASAWNSVKSVFGFGKPDNDNKDPAAASGALPSFDVGGYVPGSAGSPMKALVHGGERILNLAETSLFERVMGGLDALGMAAMPPAMMAPALAPVSAGPTMQGASFDLNGIRVGGFSGPPSAVAQLRRTINRTAAVQAAAMPRWKR